MAGGQDAGPGAEEQIRALIAGGDYAAAAALTAATGDLRRAIQLYERVWRFHEALALAEQLGDSALTIRLALDAHQGGRAVALAAAIPDDQRAELDAATAAFVARGRWMEAAPVALRAGAFERAAQLFRKAGAPLAAAEALERAEAWNEAGRLYQETAEAATRDGDELTAARARLGLGTLLGRLGRPREAARALQSCARHPQTAEAARRRLCVELGAMGLWHAADEVAARLHQADPRLPNSGAAIAELTLQAGGAHPSRPDDLGSTAGRALAAEPLRRFGELRLIGAGALGRVYAAEDRLLGETVVLKILSVGSGGSPEERLAFARFLREAEASSRLRHPNIVRLRDVDARSGILVLEYLPGGTLAEVLARQGRLSPPQARRLALEILSALDAAHRAGIVHRDVKPANIFFDAAGNAKLADFGAAHLVDFGGTQTAGFIGTLAYLSPEQITGASIGPAADLYALAVTLFETLTGRLPYLGPDIVGQHLGEAPPLASELQPSLGPQYDQVIVRALAKSPEDRFQSAVAMAELVRAWPATALPAAPNASAGPQLAPVTGGDGTPPVEAVRTLLGHTGRGQLYLGHDLRVGRQVLIEKLDAPLSPEERQGLSRLARAGGAQVQRVLALGAAEASIIYEAFDGPLVPAAELSAAEVARLVPAWAELAAAGVNLPPGAMVARTDAGPVIMVVGTGGGFVCSRPVKQPPPLAAARTLALALAALGLGAGCDGTKEIELPTRTVRAVRNNDGGPPIQLVGSGTSTCSHGLAGDSPSGQRWCAFARAAGGGSTELWVVNVSRALIDERAATCDGSSPHCLLLSTNLWDEAPLFEIGHPYIHGFTGDTLIFYADSRSRDAEEGYLGPVRAWRPGMTNPRQITGPSGFSCTGHLRSDGVICLENESGFAQTLEFDLTAGRLSGGAATEPLPRVRRIRPYGTRRTPAWQVGFSPSGGELLVSSQAPDGTVERLEMIPSSQVGQMEPRELSRNLSRWEVSPDGSKIFYLGGYVGLPDGDGMGTLTVADFPAMTNPVELATRVAAYEVYGAQGARGTGPARSATVLQEASIEGGTLRMIPDLSRPTEVVTVATNVSDPRVSPDLRYSIVENVEDGVTYLAHNGGAGQCPLAADGVNAFGVAFAGIGRRVFWMQSAPVVEGISAQIEAWTADPEGCAGRRKFVDKIAFIRPTRAGLLYGQEEESPATMAVYYDPLTTPATPPTLLARTVDPQFSVIDDRHLIFTISGENRDAGLWVHGPVP